MKVLVLFVEVTEYNLALIERVYSQMPEYGFSYVFGAMSMTGHETARVLPEGSVVLSGKNSEKIDKIKRIIKEGFDFAVINGYTGAVNAWLIRYCRKRGIPYAIESDTQLCVPANPVKRLIKRIYLRRIFSGRAYGFPGGTRQTRLFRYYGMPDDRIFIMPMTVDTDQFRAISELRSKEEYKEDLGFSGKRVILYAGRFASVKDIPCLLRAAAALKKEHDDFIVCLIGKGEEKPKLERLTEELGLQDVVRFYGYQLMPRLAEFYSAADVFVLPSAYEPWGLVVNEALACRVPVIASDAVGCVDDLILPGENGVIFHTGDENELFEKLNDALYGSEIEMSADIIAVWNYQYYRSQLLAALEKVKNEYKR